MNPLRLGHFDHGDREAHLGGADAITVHLREDRRHIVDRDVELLRASVQTKLNLEMAATDEMLGIACRLKPEMATLVPEGRHEVTTEGGLDVAGQEARLKEVVGRMQDAGIYVSLFIDADPRRVKKVRILRPGAALDGAPRSPPAAANG